MCQHVDDTHAHERRKADGVTGVIGEHHEGAAVRDETAMDRDAVHGRAHRKFTHAIADIATALFRREIAVDGGNAGKVRMGKVSRAADHFRQRRRQAFKRDLACLAGRNILRLVEETLFGIADDRCKAFRQNASDTTVEFGAFGCRQRIDALLPCFTVRNATRTGFTPGIEQRGRNFESFRCPAECCLGGGIFSGTQRRAMHAACTGAIWRTIANDGLERDQRRAVGLSLGARQRRIDSVVIVTVNLFDIPAASLELGRNIVGEGDFRAAVDGDAVIIIKQDQLAEAKVTGKRDRFLSHAFHEAAVAAEHIRAVIDNILAELIGERAFGDCHADRAGETLTERAGGQLNAFCMTIFRMTGGLRTPLPEVLQLIDGHILVARQIERAVKQHRAVTVGEHETVAVRPVGSRCVEFQMLREQNGCGVSHAERHSRMAGIGGIDGIDRESANAVGELQHI